MSWNRLKLLLSMIHTYTGHFASKPQAQLPVVLVKLWVFSTSTQESAKLRSKRNTHRRENLHSVHQDTKCCSVYNWVLNGGLTKLTKEKNEGQVSKDIGCEYLRYKAAADTFHLDVHLGRCFETQVSSKHIHIKTSARWVTDKADSYLAQHTRSKKKWNILMEKFKRISQQCKADKTGGIP